MAWEEWEWMGMDGNGPKNAVITFQMVIFCGFNGTWMVIQWKEWRFCMIWRDFMWLQWTCEWDYHRSKWFIKTSKPCDQHDQQGSCGKMMIACGALTVCELEHWNISILKSYIMQLNGPWRPWPMSRIFFPASGLQLKWSSKRSCWCLMGEWDDCW